jgi:hypothetical protein
VTLPNNFQIRFYLAGCTSSSQYCNLDNITINVTPAHTETDGLDYALSADGGTTWSSNFHAFTGSNPPTPFSTTIPAEYLTSRFMIRFYLVGFSGYNETCSIDNINLSGTPAYTSSDGLDIALSSDGGVTWSSNIPVFRGAITTAQPLTNNFTYTVPNSYLTSNFKMRFTLVGCSFSGAYCNLDNITMAVMVADKSVVFKINNQQVYLDSSGTPQKGSQELTASKVQTVLNYSGSSPHGFSYSCYRDVTDLVRAYTAKAPDPAINYPGHATYTVGGVYGDTNDEWSYAGWSLIIIYTSASTQGHQLYLFDKFVYSNQDVNNGIDVDYDGDGQPGGSISGFIVPQPIGGEVNAAKITCFVGEGDECYSGDFLALNAPASYSTHPIDIPDSYKLWDGTTSAPPGDTANQPNNAVQPDNVWNSKSVGLNAAGIDVDTFNVTWASGLINPGDTSARFDMYTRIDVWNLVYIIVSFRTQTTTKGALNYLIR